MSASTEDINMFSLNEAVVNSKNIIDITVDLTAKNQVNEDKEDTEQTSLTGDSSSDTDIEDTTQPTINELLEKTWSEFRWQKNGTKQIPRTTKEKANNQLAQEGVRIHFRCGSFSKPNVVEGCKTRYMQDFVNKEARQDTALSCRIFNDIPHNHLPPSRVVLDVDVRDIIKNQVRNGCKCAAIEKDIINNIKPDDMNKSNRVPSRNQIQGIINEMRFENAGLNREEAVKQVIDKFGCGENGKNFVRYISVHPITRVLMMTNEAITWLKKHGSLIMVDGTFETVELGLILTTVLLEIEGMAVPSVWLLSDKQTTENYVWMFKKARKLCPTWVVQQAFADFEMAMRAAISIVWPGAIVYGDSFHFFYDNRQWARRNRGSEFVEDIDESLHILYVSPNVAEFRANLTEFISQWTVTWPAYAMYFNNQWLKKIPPKYWAKFALPSGARSGDHKLEGYHNRLEVLGMKEKKQLDFAVADLYSEAKYFCQVMLSPLKMTEHVGRILQKARNYQARGTLANWKPKNKAVKKMKTSSTSTAAPASTMPSVIFSSFQVAPPTASSSPVFENPADAVTAPAVVSLPSRAAISVPLSSLALPTASMHTLLSPASTDRSQEALHSNTENAAAAKPPFATIFNSVPSQSSPIMPQFTPSSDAQHTHLSTLSCDAEFLFGVLPEVAEPAAPSPNIQSTAVNVTPSARRIRGAMKCACGKSGNKDCSRPNRCIDCCAATLVPCLLALHRTKAEALALQNPHYQLIKKQIEAKGIVSIKYNGPSSTRPKQWRIIRPEEFRTPLIFGAWCVSDNILKTYHLGHVEDSRIPSSEE